MFLKSQHIQLSVTETITRDEALIPPGRRTGCHSARILADPAWVRLWGEEGWGDLTPEKSSKRTFKTMHLFGFAVSDLFVIGGLRVFEGDLLQP